MENKETIEEAAEKYASKIWDYSDSNEKTLHANCNKAFLKGAKWQQENSYSEEEVKKLAFNFYYDMSHKMGVAENLISENATNVDVWFNEQFKKK